MSGRTAFDHIQLPYMGGQTAEIARRLAPYYHSVFMPATGDDQVRSLVAEGCYYRPFAASQDLSLVDVHSMDDCLARLNSKRKNDIAQAVRKARNQGIEVSMGVFRRDSRSFADLYEWYFEAYRPYAAIHFPNTYKYMFAEDLNLSLLDPHHNFVLLRAKRGSEIVGASFLAHVPLPPYCSTSSLERAFPGDGVPGDLLQMYVLSSWHPEIGNINTFLYYCMIEWAISRGYRFFSFGRENIVLPPGPYLNVLGSKRSWKTTTVLHYEADSQIVWCNKAAMLYLGDDYYIFHSDLENYFLSYFANEGSIPKILSHWLEGDPYIRKQVYTRNRRTFSYLEKRQQRWKNTALVLCNPDASEQTRVDCA